MASMMQERLARWQERLQNLTVSPLTRDYPEPSHNESEKRPIEAFQSLELSQETQNSLKQLQITDGAKPHSNFAIFLTALVILVGRLTGDENICLGTSGEKGRPFVLRADFDTSESFETLLVKIEKIFEQYSADSVPLDRLLSHLKSISDSEKTPVLYRFALYHAPDAPSQEYLSTTYDSTDLVIYLASGASGTNKTSGTSQPKLRAYFNQRLFASARIATILSQLSQLVKNASLNPQEAVGRIDMADDEQKSVIPDPTRDLNWSAFRGAIHDIFASNAQSHPDRLCVVETASGSSPRREFTYKQINEASNILAHHLICSGIQLGEVVMVYAHRGVDLVVAVMGVLKAGATFSVIDPAYPPFRQNIYLDVARPRALVIIEKATTEAGKLTDEVRSFIKENLQLRTEIPALVIQKDGSLLGGSVDGKDVLADEVSLKSTLPGVVVGPDSTPTLSFTSGSEGRPKGVRGRHFSLAYYFPWMFKTFNLSENDKFSMLSGIAHDPIQRDIFTPLFLGAQLLVPSRDDIQNERLAEWMQEHEVTVTHLTPAMGQILVGGATAEFPSLHHAFFVGDILIKRDCRLLQGLAPNVFIVNMYGTTETQRAVSYYEIPSYASKGGYLDSMKDVIPAGRGMLDVQMLVVNRFDRSRLCAVGELGEIYVRAGGLAEGYLGSPDLSEKKFLRNWFTDPQKWIDQDKEKVKSAGKEEPWRELYLGPRDRLYRSGDLGRYTPNGDVECSGRADDQVKIRGFRIELGEIDTHLSQHPLVRENVTLVRRDKDEEPTLVSYLVPEMSKWPSWLKERGLEDDQYEEGMVGRLKRFRPLREDVRKYLSSKLPNYSVPTVIIPLARMPLNPNGKVDKPALVFPDTAQLSAAAGRRRSSHKSALSETEMAVAKLWADLIPGITARMIRPDDEFEQLGGHSITAQRLRFKVKQVWRGLDISFNAIFRNPTLKGYSAAIDRARNLTSLEAEEPTETNGAANGDAQETVDYANDAKNLVEELPKHFPFASLDFSKSITVFLTGATGFLGAYLLRDLLSRRNPSLKVIALVRAKSSEVALSRVRTTCDAYGVWSPEWTDRLQCVAGNLGEDRFGLAPTNWERISNEADVVIHNGAQVHWVFPYQTLKTSNVQGTIDALKLCAEGKPKHFAFVSSTSVLDTEDFVRKSERIAFSGGKGISETDDLEASRVGLGNGYGQTKWVGEYLVREAGRRGLQGAIIRPGYITGDSKTGVTNTDDFLIRMLKGCIQLSSRPNINNTVNQVPVDHVARIVVASAFHPPASPLGVAQVTSHPRIRFNQYLGTLESYGYKVPQVDYIPWTRSLESYVDEAGGDKDSQHALMPLFHFVTADLPSSTKAPELDDSNATSALKADEKWSGEDATAGSGVTEELMGVYLSYLVAVGFVPPPPSPGSRPLPTLKISASQKEALQNVGGRGGLTSKTSTSPHHGATGISSLQVLPDWEKVINDPARPDLALKTSPPPDEPFDIPNQRARLAEEEGMWSSRNPPSNWGYESKDETIPTRDGQGITAKIYWPQGSSRNSTTPLPLLFVAHGGGFIQGSPITEEVFMIKTILENFKFVVVSVSFRLAPEWPFPTQLNDVEDALTWSVANAERLMIDEAKVYLAGSSAGAALTAVLAQVVRDKRSVEVSGVLLNVPVLCQPAHFPISVYPFTSYDECFGTLLNTGEMRNIWASYLMGSYTTGSNPLVSPLLGDFKGLPPHYLFVAGQDPNRDEAIAYARKLKEAGVDGDITVYPGVPHEFAEFEELETTRVFRRDLVGVVGRMVKG